MAQQWRIHLPVQERWVRSLGWEDPLGKGMATHSVFLPGESQGQRSLVGYSPWGHKVSGRTQRLNNNLTLFIYTLYIAPIFFRWVHIALTAKMYIWEKKTYLCVMVTGAITKSWSHGKTLTHGSHCSVRRTAVCNSWKESRSNALLCHRQCEGAWGMCVGMGLADDGLQFRGKERKGPICS